MTIYVTPPCLGCGKASTLDLPEEQMHLWRDGMLIQHAFPDLSPDERELIISGTHSDCWAEMFPDDPDIGYVDPEDDDYSDARDEW